MLPAQPSEKVWNEINCNMPLVSVSLSFFPVSLLKDLKHANIVCLHDIIHTPKMLTLIFEYVVSCHICISCMLYLVT